jgi:hypothetical protein
VQPSPKIAFIRRQTATNSMLTETSCPFCLRVLATSENSELLTLLERVHSCKEMRQSPLYVERSSHQPGRRP